MGRNSEQVWGEKTTYDYSKKKKKSAMCNKFKSLCFYLNIHFFKNGVMLLIEMVVSVPPSG